MLFCIAKAVMYLICESGVGGIRHNNESSSIMNIRLDIDQSGEDT